MKKRYVQKMTTILLTAAMICSSVPVTAETVSENEAVVETEAVDNVQNDSAKNEQTDADINKEGAYAGEYGDSDIEENCAGLDADYEQEDQEDNEDEDDENDTWIDDGMEGNLSYSIYEKVDGTQYVKITDCDDSAKGTIEIPKEIKGIAVTSIGGGAFYGCVSLSGITIPTNVTSIGEGAFSYCMGLTSIIVEAGNTVYDSRDNCNAIIEKDTNTLIQGCNNAIIPEGVTCIGDRAFANCIGLTSITIPASVTSIGEGAFYVYYGRRGLTSITVETGNTVYDSRENCNAIIETETNTLIQGCENTKIPTSVTSIGSCAFRSCSGLISIEIPKSVTSIESNAFSNCYGLINITVEADNTVYDSRDNCNAIIEKETNTLIIGCKNTIIPKGVTSIGNYAFSSCSGLTSITIPEGVTNIGDGAFYYCSGLTSIEIPKSVMNIGERAFEDCIALTNIKIPKEVTSIGPWAFNRCYSLTSIEIPTTVSHDAFSNCSSLKSVIILEGVTCIGQTAFSDCSGLTSVEIPKSVTSIWGGAFRNCKNLTDIYYTGSKTQWNNIRIGYERFSFLRNDALSVFYYTGGEHPKVCVNLQTDVR